MAARLVVVTGGKGGPGATTLAVGLAGALAAGGRCVLLTDLDPAGGDVAAHLPVDPQRGVLVLLTLVSASLGPEQVAAETVAVGERLWVLPGLPRPAAADGGTETGLLSPALARRVLAAARELVELEVVVADAGRLLPGSVAASLLELADRSVLAARPDYLGALAARRALDAASRAGSARLVPVAVGARRRWLGDLVELAEVLGRPLAGVVPASPRRVRRAVEAAASPVRGRLGRAYARLAANLLAVDVDAASTPAGADRPGTRRALKGKPPPGPVPGSASAAAPVVGSRGGAAVEDQQVGGQQVGGPPPLGAGRDLGR